MTRSRSVFQFAPIGALATALVLVGPGCTGGSGPGSLPGSVPPVSSPPPLTVAPPVRYVAVGASDTLGYGLPRAGEQAWPQVFARNALPPGSTVVNLGVAGTTVAEVLERVPEDVARARPDVVTVWLNVNDIVAGTPPDAYEAQLGQLVYSLRGGGATAVLVANTPALDRLPAYLACRPDPPPSSPPCLAGGRGSVPSPPLVNRVVEAYNRAIARVAEREGAVLVDLHAALEAARRAGREAELVGSDGFHPSVAGHTLVARTFAEAYRASPPASSPRGPRRT